MPYQEFPVADGHIIIATGNDSQFVKLCNVLGAPELADGPELQATTSAGSKHRDELVGQAVRADPTHVKRDDLLAKLEAVKVPAGPINDLEQVFDDPQVKHRGMKLELPSKAAKAGTIPGVRTPIVIDGWKAASERPSPLLGEHTAEILREIGEALALATRADRGRRQRLDVGGDIDHRRPFGGERRLQGRRDIGRRVRRGCRARPCPRRAWRNSSGCRSTIRAPARSACRHRRGRSRAWTDCRRRCC